MANWWDDVPAVQGNGDSEWWKAVPAVTDTAPTDNRNWLMRQAGAVGGALQSGYEGVKGAIQGQQDPAFADVPGFTGEGLSGDAVSAIQRAKLTSASVDDAAYADIVKSTLGERLKGSRRDKFGQEIVTYTGDDGKERTVYVNKPGLDWQDVDRGISGAVPYVVGATAAGRFLKGMPLLARAAGQGTVAGLVGSGEEFGAKFAGSEQPFDVGRVGTTAAFGAGGEAVSAGVGALYRRFIRPDMFDDQTGMLTAAGVKEARKLGIDPAEIQGELARRFEDIADAANPQEAIAALKGGEFNIPTTRGQRTKNPEFLKQEEEMRRSLYGPGARDIMTDFDTLQKARIQEGVEGIRSAIAPKGGATQQETGQGVSDALRSARAASKRAENKIWSDVPEMYPAEGATDLFPPIVQERFRALDFLPDQQLTPAAHKAVLLLEDYLGGKPVQQSYKLFGEESGRPSLDEMRRRLLAMTQAASTGQDRAATKAIYDSFNDWIDTLSAQGKTRRFPAGSKVVDESQVLAEPVSSSGDIGKNIGAFIEKILEAEQPGLKLVAARKFTKEQRRLFNQRGRDDAAGKILENLAQNGDTPERIVGELFGASVNTPPKAGTVGALKRLRKIFNTNNPEAWDHVKAAYWVRVTRGKNGEMLTPGNLRNSIDKALENQKSALDVLFTADEQAMMRRYRDAVDAATFTPPNPSGTSYNLASMKKSERDPLLKYLLRRMGTRATFQGKPLKGAIFHGAAKKAPDVFGTAESVRKMLAQTAVNQAIPRRRPSAAIPLGALGSQYSDE